MVSSKKRTILYTGIQRFCWGDHAGNSPRCLVQEKSVTAHHILQMVEKKFDDMFIRFDRLYESDGRI